MSIIAIASRPYRDRSAIDLARMKELQSRWAVIPILITDTIDRRDRSICCNSAL
jgi:hypothetical protein